MERWWDRTVGLGLAALTAVCAVLILDARGVPGEAAVGISFGVLFGSLLIYWVIAQRRAPMGRLDSGEVEAARIRDEEVELLKARVAELEERQDFSERLLAQGDRVVAPGDK